MSRSPRPHGGHQHSPVNLPKATAEEQTTRLSHSRPVDPLIPWLLVPWKLASDVSPLPPVDKGELLVKVAAGGVIAPVVFVSGKCSEIRGSKSGQPPEMGSRAAR